ncbi:hypothetical protein BUPH_04180 [Paraburkholderia phenoliruptrix BR3459a]|uniref:Uncharacterized protein n=1 Tax=Paraburkholderia phenoliruptrix BR3459a TaxID=1229205 RepID=K0DI39_9BURK|nr:hypothetical protein BUPH_04180 [Paraburkholderia phenoliruptrix BR3459a]
MESLVARAFHGEEPASATGFPAPGLTRIRDGWHALVTNCGPLAHFCGAACSALLRIARCRRSPRAFVNKGAFQYSDTRMHKIRRAAFDRFRGAAAGSGSPPFQSLLHAAYRRSA